MNSTLQHLRFPFSFLLLPVFLLALLTSKELFIDANLVEVAVLFMALHLFLYPSSNAFNSLQDKDLGSIGMVKKPLPVSPKLIYWTLALDFLGLLIIAIFCSPVTLLLCLAYVLASRLYSWRKVRLKQYPILGFVTVFLFQGTAIYMATIASLNQSPFEPYYLKMALISSFLFGGAYPLTQIYQHQSDREDGVKTISMVLGINGTFIFSGAMFIIGLMGLLFCNDFEQFSTHWGYVLVCILPVLTYFLYWQVLCFKDKKNANYSNTMRAVILSALCMNLFMLALLFLRITS